MINIKFSRWGRPREASTTLEALGAEPRRETTRVLAIHKNIVLPTKIMVIAVVFYYLYFSRWLYEVSNTPGIVLEAVQEFFVIYVLLNAMVLTVLFFSRRATPEIFQWLIFGTGLLDGLFVAALILVTGGFDSTLYWVLPGLIVINAMSIPKAMPQILLNITLSIFYLGAGILNINILETEENMPSLPPAVIREGTPVTQHRYWTESAAAENTTEPFFLRLSILWLLTICCYGVPSLVAVQRRIEDETREFNFRQDQLRAAGRLAAEIAHQLKNPLGIINNAAFSLQRSLDKGKGDPTQQIQLIKEEVEKADQIITQIMGYAQLSEGRVERLNVNEEAERAIRQVFPPGTSNEIAVRRNYDSSVPPMFMQRSHLLEIFMNILQNSREAMHNVGEVSISTRRVGDHSVEITMTDNGPGITEEKWNKVFEAYFTDKEKGTGLGLAIVKHNIELYGGKVKLESGLGNGTRFILFLPGKTQIKPLK